MIALKIIVLIILLRNGIKFQINLKSQHLQLYQDVWVLMENLWSFEAFNLKVKSISYEDLIYKQKKDKEKWLFINKKILKKFKFPEIDYYVPEGLTWIKVSKNINFGYLIIVIEFFIQTPQIQSHTHLK